MPLITATIKKTKQDNGHTATPRVGPDNFFGNRIKGHSCKNSINQAVQEFIDIRHIGQDNSVARLMGKEKDYPHNGQHGDKTIPGLPKKHRT